MASYTGTVTLASPPAGNVLVSQGSTTVSVTMTSAEVASAVSLLRPSFDGIYVPSQSTAPDPAVAHGWLDTSTTPPTLKGWNGTAWVAVDGTATVPGTAGGDVTQGSTKIGRRGATSNAWAVSPDQVVPWSRETLTELLADSNVPAAAQMYADDQGGFYGTDGATALKNLRRFARLDENLVYAVGAHSVPLDGTTDTHGPLTSLLAAMEDGAVLYFHPKPGSTGQTAFALSAGLEIGARNIPILGSDARQLVLYPKAGYTESQLIRNWTLSDYTSGETDHRAAPNSTAWGESRYLRVAELQLSANGLSNLDLFAYVHGQETSRIADLILSNVAEPVYGSSPGGTGNRGLVLLTNQTSGGGQFAESVTLDRIVQYSAGWGDGGFITADGTNGGKNNAAVSPPNTMIHGVKFRDIVSSTGDPGTYSGSPLKLTNAVSCIVDNPRVEALPPDTATDSAQLRLHNCSGIKVFGGNIQVGGFDTARPMLKNTHDTNWAVGNAPSVPQLRGVATRRSTTSAGHGWTGNFIEDDVSGLTWAGSIDCREIIEYSAARFDYEQGATRTLVRGIAVPAASTVKHSISSIASVNGGAGTTEQTIDTYTIPANSLTAGKLLRFLYGGNMDFVATSGNITLNMRINGTLFASMLVTSQASAATGRGYTLVGDLFVQSIGASGAIAASALYRQDGSQSSGAPTNTFTIDTTAAITITFTATFATANAGNIVRLNQANFIAP